MLAVASVLVATAAAAQPTESFFARKTITVTIGYTAGGSYDLYGRMVARHLGKHIAGQPTLIAQNMPGAGSLKAANYLYEIAPKDGTALGIIVESAALEQARSPIPPSNTTRPSSIMSGASPPATTSSCSGIPPRCSRSTTPSAWRPRSPAPARARSQRPCRGC
jgi:tripartite-type tricarboxylate transporter receptor subunit TctC